MDKKPINEQIVEAMAQIMALEDTAAETRAEIARRKAEIRDKIKEMGFDTKAFNKVLQSFRIMSSPQRKAEWLQLQSEIAKIQVALQQPTLFDAVQGLK